MSLRPCRCFFLQASAAVCGVLGGGAWLSGRKSLAAAAGCGLIGLAGWSCYASYMDAVGRVASLESASLQARAEHDAKLAEVELHLHMLSTGLARTSFDLHSLGEADAGRERAAEARADVVSALALDLKALRAQALQAARDYAELESTVEDLRCQVCTGSSDADSDWREHELRVGWSSESALDARERDTAVSDNLALRLIELEERFGQAGASASSADPRGLSASSAMAPGQVIELVQDEMSRRLSVLDSVHDRLWALECVGNESRL